MLFYADYALCVHVWGKAMLSTSQTTGLFSSPCKDHHVFQHQHALSYQLLLIQGTSNIVIVIVYHWTVLYHTYS